jgi:hypothetical protein
MSRGRSESMRRVDGHRAIGLDRDMEHAEATRASTSSLSLVAGIALLVGLVVFGWAAPATFNVYKMVHVVAAVVWVGGGAIVTVLALLTEREGDPKALMSLGHKVEVLATRIFIPASLVVLLFGILMMVKGSLG